MASVAHLLRTAGIPDEIMQTVRIGASEEVREIVKIAINDLEGVARDVDRGVFNLLVSGAIRLEGAGDTAVFSEPPKGWTIPH